MRVPEQTITKLKMVISSQPNGEVRDDDPLTAYEKLIRPDTSYVLFGQEIPTDPTRRIEAIVKLLNSDQKRSHDELRQIDKELLQAVEAYTIFGVDRDIVTEVEGASRDYLYGKIKQLINKGAECNEQGVKAIFDLHLVDDIKSALTRNKALSKISSKVQKSHPTDRDTLFINSAELEYVRGRPGTKPAALTFLQILLYARDQI